MSSISFDTAISGQVLDAGGIPRTIQRSFANASALGNNQVVAAQGAGVKIKVLAVYSTTTLANTMKFQSGVTDITAAFSLGANGGAAHPLHHRLAVSQRVIYCP